MLEVSFALTSPQIIDGTKDVTRRAWKDSHAWKFRPGRLIRCLDKDRRAGGKPIAVRRVVSCRRESLGKLVGDKEYGTSEMKREGFPGRDPSEFGFWFLGETKCYHPWRLEFEFCQELYRPHINCRGYQQGGRCRANWACGDVVKRGRVYRPKDRKLWREAEVLGERGEEPGCVAILAALLAAIAWLAGLVR